MNEKGITLHYSIALQLHYLKRVFEKSSQNISPKRFFPRQERSSIFGFPLKFHYSCKRTHNMIFSASYSVMSTFLKYCTKDLKKKYEFGTCLDWGCSLILVNSLALHQKHLFVYSVYCIYVICKSCKSCNVLARATATSNSTILAVKNIAIFVCCY